MGQKIESPFPDQGWRRCVRCGVQFWSLSKGNRRCDDCKRSTSSLSGRLCSVNVKGSGLPFENRASR
jgi:hypothetical protein